MSLLPGSRWLAAVWCLSLVSLAQAAGPEASMLAVDGEVPVRARLVSDVTGIPREGNGRVAVVLEMSPGWHIYATEPGPVGAPTRISLASGDAQMGALSVPPAQHFSQFDGADAIGYAGVVVATNPFVASDSVGSDVELSADVRLLACKVLCVPGRLHMQTRIPVSSTKHLATALATTRLFEQAPLLEPTHPAVATLRASSVPMADASLWWMLSFALLGGLVLNVMPCVLPVLVMKAAGLVAAGTDRSTRRRHALGYVLGTWLSMATLAGVVIVMRALGLSAGWGFQMQQPAFLAAVALALTLFCLHAFDVYTLSVPVGGISDQHARSAGVTKSALEGVLAVLVATPCSAPLLGTATAFALAQPAPITLLLFVTIGTGLALPFVTIALWPSRRGLLPRPGAWMGVVKQTLGFALLGTVFWLVWLFAAVAGTPSLFGLLVVLWLASVGATVLGRIERVWPAHGGKRFLLLVVVLALLADGMGVLAAPAATQERATTTQASQKTEWAAWSPAAVQRALQDKRPVLVEFTADWCVTCQYNERVLQRSSVQDIIQQQHIVLLRADWTRPDDAILAELQKRGRVGVPMTLIFWPNRPDEPLRLPEVLTEAALVQALHQP